MSRRISFLISNPLRIIHSPLRTPINHLLHKPRLPIPIAIHLRVQLLHHRGLGVSILIHLPALRIPILVLPQMRVVVSAFRALEVVLVAVVVVAAAGTHARSGGVAAVALILTDARAGGVAAVPLVLSVAIASALTVIVHRCWIVAITQMTALVGADSLASRKAGDIAVSIPAVAIAVRC
jgi:hypothetical protein